jgi:hypothetical protein
MYTVNHELLFPIMNLYPDVMNYVSYESNNGTGAKVRCKPRSGN